MTVEDLIRELSKLPAEKFVEIETNSSEGETVRTPADKIVLQDGAVVIL